MKELSIEEKAQRYDEAIEIAKEINNEQRAQPFNVMTRVFPELKMSEDERIRKELIDYFSASHATDTFRGIPFDKVVAWLEKQGEPIDKIVKRAMTEKQRVLLTETNGDANIDWDTRSLQDVKLLLEYGLDYIKKLEKQSEHWLNSLKDRVQPQPKQEWKQENTGDLTDFENAMMHIGGSFFGENAGLDPNDTNAIKEQANFLLELVPSKEWSEEDENRFNNLIFLVECSKENEPTKKGFINFIHRLKSTNYQKQWKPTEEQLDIIDMILTDEAMDDNVKSILKELKGQLKKLREE